MNANAPRISGLEPPEAATDTQSAPELAAATVEAEPPMTEAPRSSKLSLRTLGLIAAILVAAGAGLYTCILQQQVQVLRTQLVRTQAAAQAALGEINSLKIPKDLSADVASLEATVNKLKSSQRSPAENLRRGDQEDSGPGQPAGCAGQRSGLKADRDRAGAEIVRGKERRTNGHHHRRAEEPG